MIEAILFSIFCLLFGTAIIFISLKLLSDYISCIGVYHKEDLEDFLKKCGLIIKYNYFLSLPFIYSFYSFINQIVPEMSPKEGLLLSGSITIVILFNARILSNPTEFLKPIECSFITDSEGEILKIKERILSFFYAFTAINVINIVVVTIYELIFATNENILLKLNFAKNEIFIIIVTYIVFLTAASIIGELILRRFKPLIMIGTKYE